MRKKPLGTDDPLVLQFYELGRNFRRGGWQGIAKQAGIAVNLPTHWLDGRNPSLSLFQAALNVLGYELAIRSKTRDDDVGNTDMARAQESGDEHGPARIADGRSVGRQADLTHI